MNSTSRSITRGTLGLFLGPWGPLGLLRLSLWIFSTHFRLELDKVLGNFVIGSLRKNSQNCQTSFVHLYTSGQGKPARTRALELYKILILQSQRKIMDSYLILEPKITNNPNITNNLNWYLYRIVGEYFSIKKHRVTEI